MPDPESGAWFQPSMWYEDLACDADPTISSRTSPGTLRLGSPRDSYTREEAKLHGYSDSSWETARSTSGWIVLWPSAALSWTCSF